MESLSGDGLTPGTARPKHERKVTPSVLRLSTSLLVGASLHLSPRLPLPPRDLLLDPLNDVLLCARLAKRVDELPVRVHEVEEDRVVDQVVVVRLCVGRRREVHAVRLARRLERRVVTRQPDQAWVELGHVARDLRHTVARGVDGDEDGLDYGAVLFV